MASPIFTLTLTEPLQAPAVDGTEYVLGFWEIAGMDYSLLSAFSNLELRSHFVISTVGPSTIAHVKLRLGGSISINPADGTLVWDRDVGGLPDNTPTHFAVPPIVIANPNESVNRWKLCAAMNGPSHSLKNMTVTIRGV